jgi:hypothetical protein
VTEQAEGLRLPESRTRGRSKKVEIPKEQILELLQEKGASDQATQADQELPDQVDTEQHADLLSRFGIGPEELISRFGGGLLGG